MPFPLPSPLMAMPVKQRLFTLVIAALFAGGLLLCPLAAQPLDMEKFKEMKARSVGPAGMSGRVSAIDVVLRDPATIYVGSASGGLWKSTSGGTQWEPLFDEQPVASIGAIAINQQMPDLVWAGTGEGNPRNSMTNGNGIYKSLDGGKSWRHMGLQASRSVHRLLLHPTNPDIVYAAVQGAAWGENPERGIYKTIDGGQSWQKILYVDQKTGAADLVMDPHNPNKLLAAMWEYRRWPWFFKSGGPGSGLYITHDGGQNWKKLGEEEGLPKGELGRMGLAIAPSDPNRIYALIETKKNALYRSEDGGAKWQKIADDNVGSRPFYYADIFVDPQNENRIYNLHSIITLSEDGGKTFRPFVEWDRVHPDHHAWWVHPQDPDYLINGNDGGLAISRDRGKTWRFVENLPLAQFYHINVDNEMPYHIYGGMQDNGSWRGPAYVWRHGGIRNAYWEEVAFGDGFDVVPDSSDPRYLYAMWQGGNLLRTDILSGAQKYIKPTHPQGVTLRFNWDAGIAHDPFDRTTIYYGSQFLHKSTDRGDSWEIISPDLTSNDPEKQKQLESGGLTYDVTNAENHTTIVAVTPSPLQRGLIWVGSDDGNLQLTTDGGRSWENQVKRLKGVPPGTWVKQIHASRHNAGEAFVVLEDHRRNNWATYVFHSSDYGKRWRSLATRDVTGYALSIVQDPVVAGLLFLGTEFGLYVSIDYGATWRKWTAGYPTVSTMDMVIHPREHDLVIGTFGRAAYVLDDIGPLREIAASGPAILGEPLHLFPIRDAYLANFRQAAGTRFAAEAAYSGENRPSGALLTISINKPETTPSPEVAESSEDGDDSTAENKGNSHSAADSIKIEIRNNGGDVIRTYRHKIKDGINRLTWGLDRTGVRFPGREKPKAGAAEPGGPSVLPGDYTVRVSYGEHSVEQPLTVHMDPRLSVSESDLQAREALMNAWMDRVKRVTEAADRLRDARKRIGKISALIGDRQDAAIDTLKARGKKASKKIGELLNLINSKEVQGIRYDPQTLSAYLGRANRYISYNWDAPTQGAAVAMADLDRSMSTIFEQINQFFGNEWQAYRQSVEGASLQLFDDYQPLRVE